MTTQMKAKIEKIYEVIADKTLNFGCIPWYEDLYVVSTKWDVFSVWWGRRWTTDPKRIKPHYDRQWYLHLALCKDWKRKEFFVHRLVAITHIWLPKEWQEINHKDWVKDNNDINNLERCTSSENTKHSYENWLQIQKKWNRKIRRIYEEIMYPNYDRWHTMVMWCCMIWDVLDWIEKQELDCNPVYEKNPVRWWPIEIVWNNRQYIIKLREYKRKPIEEQSAETIDFIYSLID